jgi:hypothetical protein
MLKYAIVGFLLLEVTNVLTLYFFPDSKLTNGTGVFMAREKSKQDIEIHDLINNFQDTIIKVSRNKINENHHPEWKPGPIIF